MHCIPPNSRPIGEKAITISCCENFNLCACSVFFHTASEFSQTQASNDADQTMLGEEVMATSTGVHTLHNVIGTTEHRMQCIGLTTCRSSLVKYNREM